MNLQGADKASYSESYNRNSKRGYKIDNTTEKLLLVVLLHASIAEH